MTFFRLGVDPWRQRCRGGAVVEVRTDLQITRAGAVEEDEEATFFRPFDMAQWSGTLRQGDVVDVFDYRGVGMSLIEQVDPWGEKWFAWKSWEEYGYCVPPVFCVGIEPKSTIALWSIL